MKTITTPEITKKSLHLNVSKSIGEVSALFYSPSNVKYIMTFAHGAGAGIKNKFMEEVAVCLAEYDIATLRFNFPYIENGRKIPDSKAVCAATIKAAVEKASKLSPELPLFTSGKSFGGRMTSTTASEGQLQNIKGIIFFGFPLHPPGKPSTERADHLFSVNVPMLFLQGSRDALATMELLKPVCKKLGNTAELFIIEGADHSFHVPKDNKLSNSDVIKIMCEKVKGWVSLL